MYLLSVNLYEFGQFLKILLWIFLPMVLIALLITTWLHYRKKGTTAYSHPSEQFPDPSGDRLASGFFIGDPTAALPEESGNAYRGLLWMKDKYEQYREQTDRKFEKLKEDLARAEEITVDQEIPLHEKDQQIGLLHIELEERIRNYHELKELLSQEKDLLALEQEKTADLTAKLQANIELLRRLHQEMDRSRLLFIL